MNISELAAMKDGVWTPCGVWRCGECGVLYGGTRDKNGEELAEKCCKPYLCACGADCGKHWTACKACRDAKELEKEKKRFEKAKKVPFAEYTGFGCFDPKTDKFYEEIEYLTDHYEDGDDCEEGETPPKYAWGTTEVRPRYDADYVIEHISQDMFEDYPDSVVDPEGLQKFLDEWCARQPSSYELDYSTAILLPEVDQCSG
jgi:hypothetical protein